MSDTPNWPSTPEGKNTKPRMLVAAMRRHPWRSSLMIIGALALGIGGGAAGAAAASSGSASYNNGYDWAQNVGGPLFCGNGDCPSPSDPGSDGGAQICQGGYQGYADSASDNPGSWESGCEDGFSDYLKANCQPTY